MSIVSNELDTLKLTSSNSVNSTPLSEVNPLPGSNLLKSNLNQVVETAEAGAVVLAEHQV